MPDFLVGSLALKIFLPLPPQCFLGYRFRISDADASVEAEFPHDPLWFSVMISIFCKENLL